MCILLFITESLMKSKENFILSDMMTCCLGIRAVSIKIFEAYDKVLVWLKLPHLLISCWRMIPYTNSQITIWYNAKHFIITESSSLSKKSKIQEIHNLLTKLITFRINSATIYLNFSLFCSNRKKEFIEWMRKIFFLLFLLKSAHLDCFYCLSLFIQKMQQTNNKIILEKNC